MTAVKSLTHIQQLASQRLPVPSAEVERLCERVRELEKAFDGVTAMLAKATYERSQARNQALEEAAVECEFAADVYSGCSVDYSMAEVAAHIRSLMDKGE